MRTPARQSQPAPRLFLDHGADESTAEDIWLEERGFTFESPWQFPPMSELTVCLAWHDSRLGDQRMPVEGVTLASRKIASGRYETTVLFLDLPDEQKAGVREFSQRLTRTVRD